MKLNYDKEKDIMTIIVSDEESYEEERDGISFSYGLINNNITGIIINDYNKRLVAGELDFLNLPKACPKCGGKLYQAKINLDIKIGEDKIRINNTPMLKCPHCGEKIIEQKIIDKVHLYLDNAYLPNDEYTYQEIMRLLKEKDGKNVQ